jgi:hypothetical protein
MNIRKNSLKTESDQNLVMSEIEINTKYTSAKTCKIKSENQVKGKVKVKTINKQYLSYECSCLVAMLAPAEHNRGATLAF